MKSADLCESLLFDKVGCSELPGISSDFSNQKEPFFSAIEYFGAAEEDIRSAAAFAAGNIAIGNLHCFLPHLVKLVQNDKEKRLLALHALKEVCIFPFVGGTAIIANVIPIIRL